MNKKPAWQPSCNITALKKRAELLAKIRGFFADKNVLEVETPILSNTTIPDPLIASLKTAIFDQTYYLQTSPEFHMKRLLAAGSGSIFQIGKAFRADESGRLHNPEFTMLEWYRIGFDAKQLMDEIDELLHGILSTQSAIRYSYQQLFQLYLKFDPLVTTVKELQSIAKKNKLNLQGLEQINKDAWLNLLMSYCIEPQLNEKKQPYFIYDFPLSQAALARQSKHDPRVAERFEVYLHGTELANGFHELTDANEQRLRFVDYLIARQYLGLEQIPMPENFLAALESGLPDCAGVALGIDRLLMLAQECNSIEQVMSFTVERA